MSTELRKALLDARVRIRQLGHRPPQAEMIARSAVAEIDAVLDAHTLKMTAEADAEDDAAFDREQAIEAAAKAVYAAPACSQRPAWDEDRPGHCEFDRERYRVMARDAIAAYEQALGGERDSSDSPGFWPGDSPGGVPGVTDREEVGPIGAGTPHARMHWFWERMRPHEAIVARLTGWNLIRSDYRWEAAIADAFDALAMTDCAAALAASSSGEGS